MDPSIHGGGCPFCGTQVQQEFKVCTGCGAEWRQRESVARQLVGLGVIWSVTIVGIPMGLFFFFSALVAKVVFKSAPSWEWARVSATRRT